MSIWLKSLLLLSFSSPLALAGPVPSNGGQGTGNGGDTRMWDTVTALTPTLTSVSRVKPYVGRALMKMISTQVYRFVDSPIGGGGAPAFQMTQDKVIEIDIRAFDRLQRADQPAFFLAATLIAQRRVAPTRAIVQRVLEDDLENSRPNTPDEQRRAEARRMMEETDLVDKPEMKVFLAERFAKGLIHLTQSPYTLTSGLVEQLIRENGVWAE